MLKRILFSCLIFIVASDLYAADSAYVHWSIKSKKIGKGKHLITILGQLEDQKSYVYCSKQNGRTINDAVTSIHMYADNVKQDKEYKDEFKESGGHVFWYKNQVGSSDISEFRRYDHVTFSKVIKLKELKFTEVHIDINYYCGKDNATTRQIRESLSVYVGDALNKKERKVFDRNFKKQQVEDTRKKKIRQRLKKKYGSWLDI